SLLYFFFSSRRRHTRFDCDWSSDVCSSDLEQRRLHALLRRAVVYDGPAVVLPLLDDVQLVAAAGAVKSRRAVLGLEQEIRTGLPVNPLRVAVAVRPDFGPRVLLTDERVVGRHGAVVVESQNFSAERVEALRDLARGGVARRDVELAVGAEAQTRAGVELRGGDVFDYQLAVSE